MKGTKRFTSLRLLFLLLYSIHIHSCAQEDCDFTKEHSCGDVCPPFSKSCICGSRKFLLGRNYLHCCIPPSNTTQCHKNNRGEGVCPGGRAISRSRPCNGKCYNQYSQEGNTSSFNIRSGYKCDNGQCVDARYMCRGYSSCDDKTDLRACNPNITCVFVRGGVSKVYTVNSDLVDGHSKCVSTNDHNDGKYNSVTREDETNLDIVSTSVVTLDYSKLLHCNDSYNNSGVMCGNKCKIRKHWCKTATYGPCVVGDQSFTTRDPALCRNSTFWSEVSCNRYSSTRRHVSYGIRCSGSLQHCIYPWYVTNNWFYEAGFMKILMQTLFGLSYFYRYFHIFISYGFNLVDTE